ncbi:DUF7847 domain-containing protein [Haloarchaeobius sp. DT45]|uniref:DUF7847 domain-containing protein n=1 Tax=Haloarchaeobius sp. DT45 TaxID=3446116 RepID=UPI003F6BAFA7
MGAISAAKHAGQSLVRNPVIFVGTLGLALVQAPRQVLQYSGLDIAASMYVLAMTLVSPFVLGGVFSMAHEGVDGSTSLDTFVEGAKENYLTLLLSTLLLSAIFVAVVIAGLFAVLVLGVFVVGLGAAAGGAGPVGVGVFGVAFLVFVLAIVALSMLLQFYAPAIVVDDAGIGESFERSYRFATDNLASVVGFSIVKGVPGLFAGSAVGVFLFLRYAQRVSGESFVSASAATDYAFAVSSVYAGMPVETFVPLALASVASTVLIGAFTQTYLVTYYVEQSSDGQRGAHEYEEAFDYQSGY